MRFILNNAFLIAATIACMALAKITLSQSFYSAPVKITRVPFKTSIDMKEWAKKEGIGGQALLPALPDVYTISIATNEDSNKKPAYFTCKYLFIYNQIEMTLAQKCLKCLPNYTVRYPHERMMTTPKVNWSRKFKPSLLVEGYLADTNTLLPDPEVIRISEIKKCEKFAWDDIDGDKCEGVYFYTDKKMLFVVLTNNNCID